MYTECQEQGDAQHWAHDVGADDCSDGGLHAAPLPVALRMGHGDVPPHGQGHCQPDGHCVANLQARHKQFRALLVREVKKWKSE
jgi:hypothetical protein